MRSLLKYTTYFLCLGLGSSLVAEVAPTFKSTLFEKGTLIVSEDFDEKFGPEVFGGQVAKRAILKDGAMIITPRFTSKEEAMKKLKRDHHLNTGIVFHITKLPDQFVCHLRFKWEFSDENYQGPQFQIGHHMIKFRYNENGGHKLSIPEVGAFDVPESGAKWDEWMDMEIEYKPGILLLRVNGHTATYEDPKLNAKNLKNKRSIQLDFKGKEDPKSRLIFDYVRSWKGEG